MLSSSVLYCMEVATDVEARGIVLWLDKPEEGDCNINEDGCIQSLASVINAELASNEENVHGDSFKKGG